MPHQHHIWPSLCAAAVLALTGFNLAQSAPLMIVGNDEKVAWDNNGNTLLSAPGKDSVVILDLADPETPKIVANLPLKNSVVGPPVNLAIDPTDSIALVAGFGRHRQGRRQAQACARTTRSTSSISRPIRPSSPTP